MPQISLQEFGYAVSIYPILGYWFMSYEKKKIQCLLKSYKLCVGCIQNGGIETWYLLGY